MTQHAWQSGSAAPAIAPLRTLAELGDEETRRAVGTDLASRLGFPVDPGWYEKCWYGDPSPSRWGLLANAVRRLLRQVAHIVTNRFLNGETIRLDGALRMPPR